MPQAEPPFLIFSWYRPFLTDLKARILQDTGNKPGDALIIFPNRRPWRYMANLFARDGHAAVLPQMLQFTDMVALWARHIWKTPRPAANILDQVALLKRAINEIGEADSHLAAKFLHMDLAYFIPWGIKLSRLLEDIFQQGIDPKDLKVESHEVGAYESALISALGRIGNGWHKLLDSCHYTTPGLDHYIAAKNSGDIPSRLMPQPGRRVYIAGFSTLNGTQKLLFESLWKNGAQICFHTDPAIQTPQCPKACKDQQTWLHKWHAKTEDATPVDKNMPAQTFFAGYDGHSQIAQMVEDLSRISQGSVAIVLPDPALLMPILHHLPDKKVNISMGYPIKRTRLYDFLKEVFTMHTRRRPGGRFYWKDLRRLFHHPLLTMLKTPDGVSMRRIIDTIDRILNSGAPFVDPVALLEESASHLPNGVEGFFSRLSSCIMFNGEEINSPRKLAQYLSNLCDFFLENASLSIKGFPMDEEALARLRDNILPILANNEIADQEFSLATLQSLLFMLLDDEKIPFEADPLTGTQILGMLETRLLHFDNVFIMDASDDLLPGRALTDPLLPDNLRQAAGLPSSKSRSAVVSYNLFRLFYNSHTVHWYWPEGIATSSLDTSKHSRSRYLEQLIWQIEQEKNIIIKTGTDILRAAKSNATPNPGAPLPLPRIPSYQSRMAKILDSILTASTLDSYLKCPLGFAYARILGLRGQEDVNEGDDPALIGECVHKVLADIFAPYIGQVLPDKENLIASIDGYLEDRIRELGLDEKLPVDSSLFFRLAAPDRLRHYLEKMPDSLLVKAIEKTYEADIAFGDRNYKFSGRVDRIDEEEKGALIVDYKTGSSITIKQEIWEDTIFLGALQAWIDDPSDKNAGDQLLEELREKMPSIQLALYALIVSQSEDVANAAYIWLRRNGTAKKPHMEPLWKAETDVSEALAGARIILAFLLKHMQESTEFQPNQAACANCDYKGICKSRIHSDTTVNAKAGV